MRFGRYSAVKTEYVESGKIITRDRGIELILQKNTGIGSPVVNNDDIHFERLKGIIQKALGIETDSFDEVYASNLLESFNNAEWDRSHGIQIDGTLEEDEISP